MVEIQYSQVITILALQKQNKLSVLEVQEHHVNTDPCL